MVLYNVKCAGLQNKKILYAQKSNIYGKQSRSSAARYASMAQQAEDEINAIIHHYNREQVIVGDKWDHMASLPGPWGGQWQQWAMPPLEYYAGNGEQEMKIATEGGDETILPGFSVYNRDKRFIDLYNTGNGVLYWSSEVSDDWITLSEESGVISDEQRIWVSIDWDKAPVGRDEAGTITFRWSSSATDAWMNWDHMSESKAGRSIRQARVTTGGPGSFFKIDLSVFQSAKPIGRICIWVLWRVTVIYPLRLKIIQGKWISRMLHGRLLRDWGGPAIRLLCFPQIFPATVSPEMIISKSPVLEYDIYTFTEGEAAIDFNCIPC